MSAAVPVVGLLWCEAEQLVLECYGHQLGSSRQWRADTRMALDTPQPWESCQQTGWTHTSGITIIKKKKKFYADEFLCTPHSNLLWQCEHAFPLCLRIVDVTSVQNTSSHFPTTSNVFSWFLISHVFSECSYSCMSLQSYYPWMLTLIRDCTNQRSQQF